MSTEACTNYARSDESKTQVPSYRLVTSKQIPTEAIVYSVEAALSRQHELSEPTRITSEKEWPLLCNQPHYRTATTWLRMNRKETIEWNRREHSHNARRQGTGDCCYGRDRLQHKMDAFVNDKQTYEVLKRDSTPAVQRKLNNKLLTLKKTDKKRLSTLQQTEVQCSAAT